jgi:predicted peptidase
MSQTNNSLEKEITKKVKIQYLLHLPEGYAKESSQKWPLIIFLHGSGERGDNLEKVKGHGIPKIVEQDANFPFITISPQCRAELSWYLEHDSLIALIDEITLNYNVDPKRIYLTGISMGGYGTWYLAADFPEKFAAIAPVCGGGNISKITELLETPIWVFHGAKDNVVPITESQKMVDLLRAEGGDVTFTVYPEADHDSWTETYANPDLYTWFLSHSLK